LIHLDHAASTPMKREAFEAMLPYFCEQYANASGSYAASRKSRRAIDQARKEVAEAIGAKQSEVYFTSGGTESDNWAIFGSVNAAKSKKHIITTKVEHHAILRACQALENQGYTVTWLDVDPKGRVNPKSVLDAIREDTALVSVMLANNEIGTIEPVEEIALIAHKFGVLMHTDAVQAAGHIPVDVNALGVDLLSISAHKFGGPKGIGALYVRSGVKIERVLYGGEQERSMRAGTENTPAIVGMGKALTLSCMHMESHAEKMKLLRDDLQSQLLQMPGVYVNGDEDHRLPGHLHVSIDGFSSQLLLMKLDMAGIAASAGSACASGSLDRSHVVRALGVMHENQADIRFSIGEENTKEDITEVARVLRRILVK